MATRTRKKTFRPSPAMDYVGRPVVAIQRKRASKTVRQPSFTALAFDALLPGYRPLDRLALAKARSTRPIVTKNKRYRGVRHVGSVPFSQQLTSGQLIPPLPTLVPPPVVVPAPASATVEGATTAPTIDIGSVNPMPVPIPTHSMPTRNAEHSPSHAPVWPYPYSDGYLAYPSTDMTKSYYPSYYDYWGHMRAGYGPWYCSSYYGYPQPAGTATKDNKANQETVGDSVSTNRPSPAIATEVKAGKTASATDAERKQINGEQAPERSGDETMSVHICMTCGKSRSSGYHRDHPLIPGQKPETSECAKCTKSRKLTVVEYTDDESVFIALSKTGKPANTLSTQKNINGTASTISKITKDRSTKRAQKATNADSAAADEAEGDKSSTKSTDTKTSGGRRTMIILDEDTSDSQFSTAIHLKRHGSHKHEAKQADGDAVKSKRDAKPESQTQSRSPSTILSSVASYSRKTESTRSDASSGSLSPKQKRRAPPNTAAKAHAQGAKGKLVEGTIKQQPEIALPRAEEIIELRETLPQSRADQLAALIMSGVRYVRPHAIRSKSTGTKSKDDNISANPVIEPLEHTCGRRKQSTTLVAEGSSRSTDSDGSTTAEKTMHSRFVPKSAKRSSHQSVRSATNSSNASDSSSDSPRSSPSPHDRHYRSRHRWRHVSRHRSPDRSGSHIRSVSRSRVQYECKSPGSTAPRKPNDKVHTKREDSRATLKGKAPSTFTEPSVDSLDGKVYRYGVEPMVRVVTVSSGDVSSSSLSMRPASRLSSEQRESAEEEFEPVGREDDGWDRGSWAAESASPSTTSAGSKELNVDGEEEPQMSGGLGW